MKDVRPKIIVSRCLGFDACRYNGQMINDSFVDQLKSFVDFETVCPEVEIGLGIPRFPVRLISTPDGIELYQPSTEKFYTKEMTAVAENLSDSLSKAHGLILKTVSPSCGPMNVKLYSAKASVPSGKGSGIFAAKVQQMFPNLLIEDEGRLKNYKIREHFLSTIYSLARFDVVRKSNEMRDLVEYHTKHKYLLMSYNQKNLRELGSIVGNLAKHKTDIVIEQYFSLLQKTFYTEPKRSNIINTFLHIVGYFSQNMSSDEKRFFEETLSMYRDERIPMSSIVLILKSFAVRFEQKYILDQYFLSPYPYELVELSDSGRHINI